MFWSIIHYHENPLVTTHMKQTSSNLPTCFPLTGQRTAHSDTIATSLLLLLLLPPWHAATLNTHFQNGRVRCGTMTLKFFPHMSCPIKRQKTTTWFCAGRSNPSHVFSTHWIYLMTPSREEVHPLMPVLYTSTFNELLLFIGVAYLGPTGESCNYCEDLIALASFLPVLNDISSVGGIH